MNKQEITVLEDYLRDKSDVRLSLFTRIINQDFKLTKNSKEQLKLLISDYESTKDKNRLRLIETFLDNGVMSSSAPKFAPKKQVSSSIQARQLTPEDMEYNEIAAQRQSILEEIKATPVKEKAEIMRLYREDIKELDNRLDLLAKQRELKDMKEIDPLSEERKILISLFGDPEVEGTTAWKMLNDIENVGSFKIRTYFNPETMIRRLFITNHREPVLFSARHSGDVKDTWTVKKGDFVSFDQGTTAI